MTGYFMMARGALKHPRFKPAGPWSSFEAWCWMIESAAYAPCDIVTMSGRNKQIVHLEPGQLTFSVRFLAKAWRWSDKRVQRFLSALASDQSVTTQTTTGQTVITLCNWDKYQRPDFATTTQSATPVTTQTTTKKNKINKLRTIHRLTTASTSGTQSIRTRKIRPMPARPTPRLSGPSRQTSC